MKFDSQTIMAMSSKVLTARARAEAAEQHAHDCAVNATKVLTKEVWHEWEQSLNRGLTPAQWARKRRAVANGMERAFWARLARYRAMRALQAYAD